MNGDGYPDIAVGAPGEDIGTVTDAGAVWLLPAGGDGLLAGGSRSYGAVALGAAAHGARFGAVIDE
ncbi:FG-GAP repeat protein [Streptomyces sp. NPDC058299]|uniref:FG-GAP repeat protein n=1 Tax=Streptomyces sp. NPDC058299 TaxID=3346435 RepID=UPI0036F10016